MKNACCLAVFSAALLIFGCIAVDPLGTSTEELEKSRSASAEMVVPLPYGDCFSQTVMFARESGWTVFQQLPDKDLIVLMGIPGATDTTQVGVFLVENAGRTTLQIASPSFLAREKVFRLLAARFAAPEKSP